MLTPAPSIIERLDPLVANQIAAGEVVERPFSVVKELVENSLDAGATRVDVALTEGGRTLIQVTDNGHGMSEAQARLAFERHATSKLRTAAELARVQTYGFRGEALASILSVARVELTTRGPDDDTGVQLLGGGSTTLEARPVACAQGTDLIIRDLFFNVPARLKFLRTPATELGHIQRYLDAVSLARPGLHVSLRHNDRKVFDRPPDDTLLARARAVFGKQVAGRLFVVEGAGDYAVTGCLTDPGLQKRGPSHVVTLVDGRPVRDRTLHHAVAQAYGPLLESGRYPLGVIHVRCPPGAVDVNVHPAKTEVRFLSTQAIHRAVDTAIRHMLARAPWARDGADGGPTHDPGSEGAHGRSGLFGTPAARGPRDTGPNRSLFGAPRWRTQRDGQPGPSSPGTPLTPAGHVPSAAHQPALPSTEPGRRAGDLGGPVSAGGADVGATPALRWRGAALLGPIGTRWLAFADETPRPQQAALVLLDVAAARALLLCRALARRPDPVRVLIPMSVPLPAEGVAALQQHDAVLAGLGFEVVATGPRVVMVRTHPRALQPRVLPLALRVVAEAWASGPPGAVTAQLRGRAMDALQSAARGAVADGTWALAPHELGGLCRQLGEHAADDEPDDLVRRLDASALDGLGPATGSGPAR
jgi:DNA mismatch repair protein MutL